MKSVIYSISRFINLYTVDGLIDSVVRIGGRFVSDENKNYIADARGKVFLPKINSDSFANGDFIAIEFNISELNVEKNSSHKLILNVNKVSKIELLHQSVRSPIVESELNQEQDWFFFLQQVRSYFLKQGLEEVVTPSLVKNPGMEPELEPFSTVWQKTHKENEVFFLPTSPELHMKQLLVKGFSDIFEIRSVFRNEALTSWHRPEFKMIEWYRAFDNLTQIEHDLCGLIEHLANEKISMKKITVSEVFEQLTNFKLKPQTKQNELLSLAESMGLKPNPEWDWNDVFHLIWVSKIENHLPEEPFLLTHYPPSQAALAKVNSEGWAERMEFYWRGIEIANAFHELNDPIEQRKRFIKDQKKRVEYGRTPLEIDENFMKALDVGLPPCAGIALGLERLFAVMRSQIAIL